MSDGRVILFYDGDCGLCAFLRNWIHRLDRRRRVRSLPLGARDADPYLADLGDSIRFASMHVVTASGERASAGMALLRLLEALPLGGGLARLLMSAEIGRRETERVYGFLTRFRERIAG